MTQSTIGQPAAAGPVPKPRARGGLFRRGRRSPAGDGPAVPIDVNALYLLAQRLSLTAGPLRLLDGDFPRREFMQGVAEHNLNQALALVSPV